MLQWKDLETIDRNTTVQTPEASQKAHFTKYTQSIPRVFF